MPTQTFTFTGSRVSWKVPANTKLIDVVVEGGNSVSRRGGRVTGRMKVKAGDLLYITVGEGGFGSFGLGGGIPAFGGGGRGGDGSSNARPGGDGGAGASWIRYGEPDGPIRVVAGGAGGQSGDGGLGGRGGGSVADGEADRGERGFSAPNGTNPGSASTGNATGGTQNQGGKGGSTSLGRSYNGGDGGGKLGQGGRGGQYADSPAGIYGGGGGGGGYFPGGGGVAGRHGSSKGGGGAGGSNFAGGLFNATSTRGTATTGGAHGFVSITWDPAGGDEDPTAPNDIKINGVAASDGLATRSTGSVVVSGNPNDPDQKENVRLVVRYSDTSNFGAAAQSEVGTYDDQDDRDKVTLRGLKDGTRYYLRIHSQQQSPKRLSTNFTSTSFWTNRPPAAPSLSAPLENSSIPDNVNITFDWNHNDPDGPADGQSGFEFEWRTAAVPGTPAGKITTISRPNDSAETYTINSNIGGGPFAPGLTYEWRVRTRDQQDKWGERSQFRSFAIVGTALAPRPKSPKNGEAVRVDRDITFTWDYQSKAQALAQARADVRYRVTASRDRTFVDPDPDAPTNWIENLNVAVNEKSFMIPAGELEPAFRLDWQVRAAGIGAVGPWSESQTFWTVEEPGLLVRTEPVDSGLEHAGLGEGINRAYIYDRGGSVPRGEIKNIRLIRWGRTRDDMSSCLIYVDEFDEETRALIKKAHTWRQEIVVFRTNGEGRVDRVWEGPITRKSSSRNSVEIEAKDVIGYVYRRIMRQGYTDAYQEINGTQVGGATIIQRATQLLLNCLAYDDPNLIGYLTPMPNAGDSRSSGTRPDYSRMVWEEIDDMAAVKGLDYTAIGRRIVLNDTHRAIGKLPEMGDEAFSQPPVITEYGMSAAFYFAVSDGSGIWGAAYPQGLVEGDVGPEGWIEQLATAYGEPDQAGVGNALTAKQIQARREAFRLQAKRNISGRWEPPVVVRVPDNARLSPLVQVGINQLVPGVWIPLRADNGHQSIAQWQKLDSLSCEQDASGERVTVVMSPAPNGGQDPDADTAALEV